MHKVDPQEQLARAKDSLNHQVDILARYLPDRGRETQRIKKMATSADAFAGALLPYLDPTDFRSFSGEAILFGACRELQEAVRKFDRDSPESKPHRQLDRVPAYGDDLAFDSHERLLFLALEKFRACAADPYGFPKEWGIKDLEVKQSKRSKTA